MRKLDLKAIELFLIMNEPTFTISGKQYSVCCPETGSFSTWDSDENIRDFDGLESLLDDWIVDGKPFREVVSTLM